MSRRLYKMIEAARQDTCPLNGWIMITPALATEFLKLNVCNYRAKKQNMVDKYSKDMMSHLWQKNGEAIVISSDGILRNGQHRLNAIVKSGIPIVSYMIFDADNCVIFDLQSKRTCVQVLRDLGYPVSNLGPAVARTVLLGKITTSSIGDGKICDYVIANYQTIKKTESIVKTKMGNVKTVGAKASCATIVYCLLKNHEIPESELIDFFMVLNTGKRNGVKKDISAPLSLRAQIDSYPGHGDNLSNRFMEYTYLALLDFHNNVDVGRKYLYPDGGENAKRLIHEIQCMDVMNIQ